LKRRLGDRVQFLGVYVREAHPTDGWRMESNDKAGISIAQPTTWVERKDVAAQCCSKLKMTMPLLVDALDDRVGHAYSGMPDRLYVIGRDGRVVYKGGRGPFGFKVGEMEQALLLHLVDLQPPKQEARLPVLTNEQAWKHLPKATQGAGAPLPAWARVTARALPRTTAAMLELDYRHRAASPLDPWLRAKMRWVAAHANGCAYGEANALADLKRAGAPDAEVAALRRPLAELPAAPRAALQFADKLTRAAYSVTDEDVQRLRALYGDAAVVAMVQLLAYANFQDRLVLTLGLGPEPGGALPPLAVRFAAGQPAPPVPPRKAPAEGPAGETAASDADWAKLDFDYLQKQMEGQRGRAPRIPVPAWDEVKKRLPPGTPAPSRPVRIRWSLVCSGYQPELAAAWSACTRAFGEEARQDRVFEESLFWVVTRSLQCFY
jgi:alkylhydroperoxidase family enzyme